MGSRSSASRLFAAILAATTLCSFQIPEAVAEVTKVEAACRSKLAKSLGKYVKTLQKSVAKCHKVRDKGAAPEMTDCNDAAVADALAKNKAARIETKARNAVTAACSGAPTVLAQFPRCMYPFQAIDDGGATVGVDDWDELMDCEIAHLQDLVETASDRALGLPGAGLSSDQQRCHGTIAKSLFRVIDTVVKERTSCQRALDREADNLGYDCAAADPRERIASSILKGGAKILGACSDADVPAVDSCGSTAAELPTCVLEDAGDGSGGAMAALAWEFSGLCPGVEALYLDSSTRYSEDNDLDLGPTGLGHNADPPRVGAPILYTVTCDADCANCVTASVEPWPDSCRCDNAMETVCATNGDCGAGECQCFLSPPTPLQLSGYPLCATTRIAGAMTGSLDLVSGAATLQGTLRTRMFSGIAHDMPCPVCVASVCEGGDRDGSACSIHGVDDSFGNVSYDCPPSSGASLTGTGQDFPLDLTTGTFSLPFALPCDGGAAASDCACSTCTLDNSVACNSNADCSAVAAGTCRTDGAHGGKSRLPNECSDDVCSPEPGGEPHEGVCLAGPTNSYCDGLVREDGHGILACLSNSDCDDFVPLCPGPDCGTCSIDEQLPCFLDPIQAEGENASKMVGGGCVAPSSNGAINLLLGWPGAYRMQRPVSLWPLCDDLSDFYEPPSGANCM